MPEIKHNFVQGKMNKDLDERLVPNGEYRDALNVEVATSEGSNVGTIQNIKGNTRKTTTNSRYSSAAVSIGSNPFGISETSCVTVGTVTNPTNDTIVWLQHAHLKVLSTPTQYLEMDRILEYDTKTEISTAILVDNFRTSAVTTAGKSSNNSNIISSTTIGISTTGIRAGMTVKAFNSSGANLWNAAGSHFIHADAVVTVILVSGANVTVSVTNHFATTWTEDGKGGDITFPAGTRLVFEAERVLNFSSDRLITGINIVDDVLFFTDNHTEPKKVHIERSKQGTSSPTRHTKVFSNGIIQNGTPPGAGPNPLVHVQEKHITVIKKSPLFPPTLQLSNTTRGDGKSVVNTTSSFHPIYDATTIIDDGSFTANGCATYTGGYDLGASNFGFMYDLATQTSYIIDDDPLIPNPIITILVPANSDYEFLPNDNVILLANSVSNGLAKTHEIRAMVTVGIVEPVEASATVQQCYALENGLVELELELTSIASEIPLDKNEIISWDVKLDQEKESMFKFKFPRFAYRWKYEDGEYSCFSPFTEAAFVPSKFDYMPRKGFNLGMTNEVRLLHLKDFVNSETPSDVVEIDLLYKESTSANIYTVKSIKKEIVFTNNNGSQLTPSDLEWSNDLLSIESDLIYATVDSQQLLRPWDNVPRKALGQEVIANRLVFANYLQGYDLVSDNVSVVTPNFNLSVSDVIYNNPDLPKYSIDTIDNARMPERSVKSLRTYQIGIAYKDKYGRETPVITNNNATTAMSFYVEKNKASNYNQLVVQKTALESLEHPAWADSFKFFIKETSNEYYNLAMDRWYPAEDGNIWLSFPSSDRNKLDLESFIILKKQHDNDTPVNDKARYKILALQSQPPRFVTSKKFSYGNVSTSFAATGLPSTDSTFVDIDYAGFSSTGLNGSIFPEKQADLLLRITSANSKSFWYDINDITEIGSNVRITMSKAFDVDMDFTGDGSGSGNGNPSLSLEIVQERMELTKEYEGRFFAKIHRDVDLETNVLHQTETQDFIVTDTLRYTALNVSELDYNEEIGTPGDQITGCNTIPCNSSTVQIGYSYTLMSEAGDPVIGEYGHKNYLDPIDSQLVKKFWSGERAGAAGVGSVDFNLPAQAANGITGQGYTHQDSWKRFSWFIDSQWGENPIKNGISYIASKSYNYGEDLTVSEIGAFDPGMQFGFSPLNDPAATNIDYTVNDKFVAIESGFGNWSIGDKNRRFESKLSFGEHTLHNGFDDNNQIELGESQIITPNSSQVVDVYRNLDRNLNENIWKGFSNPNLYTSPGNYPRVDGSSNTNGNVNSEFNFDFQNVTKNTDVLGGKYETVDKDDYISHAGMDAYKFTAKHDDTIVQINTQIQVRPSLDCDPDHPETPYGQYTNSEATVEGTAGNLSGGAPELCYGQDDRNLIIGDNNFEALHLGVFSSNFFMTGGAADPRAHTILNKTIAQNGWWGFRNSENVDGGGDFWIDKDSNVYGENNAMLKLASFNAGGQKVGMLTKIKYPNWDVSKIGQAYSITVKFSVNAQVGGNYLLLKLTDHTGTSTSGTQLSTNLTPGVVHTGTCDVLAFDDNDIVSLVASGGGTNNDQIIEIISINYAPKYILNYPNATVPSRRELHIPVNAALPGQSFVGSTIDSRFIDFNTAGTFMAPFPPDLSTLFTEGGNCPGCMHTGNASGNSPAGMSSLPGYPNVGGLTGINVRLKLMHNNTSFTENKASGTIIDDQSTGFVPEQMGNALSFAPLQVTPDPTIGLANSATDITSGVMSRGDHFFAKNDYHLQIVLAAVEEIKLNKGESVWLEVESYEKEFNYKHYIGKGYFDEIYDMLSFTGGQLTPAYIEQVMLLNWDSTDHPGFYGGNVGGYPNTELSEAKYLAANAYYRFRGSYGGPVEIISGNENKCNLQQDFVHSLEAPGMTELMDLSGTNKQIHQRNRLGRIKHPVWGDALHPNIEWNYATLTSPQQSAGVATEPGIIDYFNPDGFAYNSNATVGGTSGVDILWNDTFQTKDRGSRLFGGVALPAGFGTSTNDKITTSASRRFPTGKKYNTGGGGAPFGVDEDGKFFFTKMGRMSEIGLGGFGHSADSFTSPYNLISDESPRDRIPKKFLTKLQMDQWDEKSTALRHNGMVSVNAVNDNITSSMYNHKHPAIADRKGSPQITATVDLSSTDVQYLSGNRVKGGPAGASGWYTYGINDHFTFKAMSSGNFINFTFQWDPADVKHTYGYPLMFPFHKEGNGATYDYDPSNVNGNIGNWNTRDTNHEAILGWIGTRIAADAASVGVYDNHTYTAESFDSDLDQFLTPYSSKFTSYRVNRTNSPTTLDLQQALDVITVQVGVVGSTLTDDCITASTHVGRQILEFDDGGLNTIGGMFQTQTLVTDVSAAYDSASYRWRDITLSKLPNMTAAYSGNPLNQTAIGIDARITFVNTNAYVLLHANPWKDDLRGVYYPPEDNGVVHNNESWYDECYQSICSALPNVIGSRDFSGYGLYDEGKKLHLSFGGINNALENWLKQAYNLSIWHPELSSNLWNLKAVGGFFRFKDDANSCIFKITSSQNSFDQNTNGVGIRNYMPAYENDSGEAFDHPDFNGKHNAEDVKDPYSKRVRFYLEIEYTGWNTNYGKLPDGTIGTSTTGNYIQNPTAQSVKMGIGHLNNVSADASDFPEVTHNPSLGSFDNPITSNYIGNSAHQGELYGTIEFLAPDWDGSEDFTSANPAMWETEPKEDLDLDIYHEASPSYPTRLTATNVENYFRVNATPNATSGIMVTSPGLAYEISLSYVYMDGDEVVLGFNSQAIPKTSITLLSHPVLRFTSQDGSYVEAKIKRYYDNGTNWLNKASVEVLSPTDPDTKFGLPYFNCFSFGNGVESDRIRDDFNAPTIGKGVKVSTTQAEQYKEERRKSSFIFSGIYNSNTGINKLNQFISLDDITKELNPIYGGIQKLHARDTDLVVFCEDKVLRVLANKDALYNADGNFQLISSKNVLGQAVPYAGEYGIAKHPESFASYGYRSYFVDEARGCVLRLSKDGIEVISNYGMKDYFRDILSLDVSRIIGSYDPHAGNYDTTIKVEGASSKTLSFNEQSNGWVSFKSYIPNMGVYLNSTYYTYKHGDIFEHYSNNLRNNFYKNFNTNAEIHYNSSVKFLFNESPGVVKSFHTLNYEGSVSNVTAQPPATAIELADGVSYHSHDGSKPPSGYGEYYDNTARTGWLVESIDTDLQQGNTIEFKSKEGKYFSDIKGEATTLSNLDTSEFSVQGIGNASLIESTSGTGVPQNYSLSINANCWNNSGIYGCMDPAALNNTYDPTATVDDGSCCYTPGCMDPVATDFNALACIDDGSCAGYIYGCMDPSAFNYATSANKPLVTVPCTAPTYAYGSWPIPNVPFSPPIMQPTDSCCCYVSGCTDPNTYGFDPNACFDDGSCIPPVYGCMDVTAFNYYPGATVSGINELCCFTLPACGNASGGLYPDINGYAANVTYDCGYEYLGAGNDVYVLGSFTPGSLYGPAPANPGVPNCIDGTSPPCASGNAHALCPYPCSTDGTINGGALGFEMTNYDPCVCDAQSGSCITGVALGCTDAAALNTTINATTDDGSCCYISGCNDNTEGSWPSYTGACRDGFVPGSADALANNPLATTKNQCHYGCTVDSYTHINCGWETFNTYNPSACTSQKTPANNPGNKNYTIDQPQTDASGVLNSISLTTTIVDDASTNTGATDSSTYCFVPTYGCFDISIAQKSDGFADTSGFCVDGTPAPCLAGNGYAASNTSAPSWCLDPASLEFPYGTGRPNDAIVNYKTVTGFCPGHTETCIYPGCMDPLALNYDPNANQEPANACNYPAPPITCQATNAYWPASTVDAVNGFLTGSEALNYAPNTADPVATFYANSGPATVSTTIGVWDNIFEGLMDNICVTSGGLDSTIYSETLPSNTTCADCIYNGWNSATAATFPTELSYCDSWLPLASWDYSHTLKNCASYTAYPPSTNAPDGTLANYRPNELFAPHVPASQYPFVNDIEAKTKVGFDVHRANANRALGFGDVAEVLQYVEYINLDGHLVNEDFPAINMIRLKELSLSTNLVGYFAFDEDLSGHKPAIQDLWRASGLKKLNFGNVTAVRTFPENQTSADYYVNTRSTTLLNMDELDLDTHGMASAQSRDADGYFVGDYNTITGQEQFKGIGNSVHHGYTPSAASGLADPSGENLIHHILVSGNTLGHSYIDLEYLNINNQRFAQNWQHFNESPSEDYLTEGNPTRIIKEQIQLDLSHCASLKELFLQNSAVPSIYVNNGFESGYYPAQYNGHTVSLAQSNLLHHDFALNPNLETVDVRNSQLFAHINFAYNAKLENLYVGRGYYDYSASTGKEGDRVQYLPNIQMIDEGLGNILSGEDPLNTHFNDHQTIINSIGSDIMPPTFDFKVNPMSLKKLEIVNERVGGSSLVTSLDKKGSGSSIVGCHNCDNGTTNIYGSPTGNTNSQSVRMDIGNPLELVSMEELHDINIRVWTNGAMGVNQISADIDPRGKSHIYFGRQDVTLAGDNSAVGGFSLTTKFYDRSSSHVSNDINIQSEIYGFPSDELTKIGVVPGAKLSGVSVDGGVSFLNTGAINCYVVSINQESIKLSGDMGSVGSLLKSPAYANLLNGAVTQNQGSDITYALHATDPNEITISGDKLQLKFTMNPPDWSRSDMKCIIAGASLEVIPTTRNIGSSYESIHPSALGQVPTTSDIVLHFGSDARVADFINQAGLVIDVNGAVTNHPTDSRFSFRDYGINKGVTFGTINTINTIHEIYYTNIYCVS